jgi:hypothetical protein
MAQIVMFFSEFSSNILNIQEFSIKLKACNKNPTFNIGEGYLKSTVQVGPSTIVHG